MERKIGLIFVVCIGYLAALAETECYSRVVYSAYIGNKMNLWKNTITKMDSQKSSSDSERMQLLNYEYGYIGWCLGNKRDAEAADWMKKMELNIETLEKKPAFVSEALAYKSALWGFKLGESMIKAPILGPECIGFAKKAVQLDGNNYLAYIQLGNIEFYMPAVFGGSKKKALDYYLKAEKCMQSRAKKFLEYDWNYLSLLITIAQTHKSLYQNSRAEEYYRKVLKVEPNMTWVRDELLPQLQNKK